MAGAAAERRIVKRWPVTWVVVIGSAAFLEAYCTRCRGSYAVPHRLEALLELAPRFLAEHRTCEARP